MVKSPGNLSLTPARARLQLLPSAQYADHAACSKHPTTIRGQSASVTALPFSVQLAEQTITIENISARTLRYVRFMCVGGMYWGDHLESSVRPSEILTFAVPTATPEALLSIRWIDSGGGEFVWAYPLG